MPFSWGHEPDDPLKCPACGSPDREETHRAGNDITFRCLQCWEFFILTDDSPSVRSTLAED
jgi:hypothetical protein